MGGVKTLVDYVDRREGCLTNPGGLQILVHLYERLVYDSIIFVWLDLMAH